MGGILRRIGFILLLCCAGLFADIGDFYFDGQKHHPGMIVGQKPVFKAEGDFSQVQSLDDFVLHVDGQIVTAHNKKYNNSSFSCAFALPLELGEREIELWAYYSSGSFQKTVTVNVRQEKGMLSDMVLFPSPATTNLNVCYELGAAQSVSFLIYNLSGQLVCRRDFVSGRPGGNPGYNQVSIDLDTYSKRPLSNGAYVAILLRPGSSTVLAKEKFLILR